MASVTVLLVISSIFPSQSEICSLYYMNSAILKSLTARDSYEFYSSVKLNDIQMSFCNSENKADFLKQFCEESKSLFRNEREELNYKQGWLKMNLNTLRNENRTNDTDLHVLQWIHSCEVERHFNGTVTFLQGTDEYAYDGKNLTFGLSMHWNESVSSLEKRCVETLTSFTDLQQERKFIMTARPEVYSSVKAPGSSEEQVLVCLATGFYPKHVQMEIRCDQMALPDEQLNSHGVRPNTDGSFQLKKSLKILPSERSRYQCVVKHQTLTEPLIVSWDEVNVLLPAIIGVGVALVVFVIIVLVFYLMRKWVKYRKSLKTQSQLNSQSLPNLGSLGSPVYELPSLSESFEGLGSYKALQCIIRYGSFSATGSGVSSIADGSRRCHADWLLTCGTDEITEELRETQSLCEAKETPAAAPRAAQGAMGSKNISLPNFAMDREDIDQNTVTQNTLQLPLPRRCSSKNISLPNLTLERKDSDDSS